MAENDFDKFLEAVIAQSPWQNNQADWYKTDGSLLEVNEADMQGFYHPPKKYFFLKREFFDALFKDNQLFGITVIRGPRRIGKTSTLKYIVRELIAEGFSAKSIFYVSLDSEELYGILERTKMLKEFLSKLIEKYSSAKPLIIILDEVTFYLGWGRALKNLIDEGVIGKGVGVVATGSYALDLTSARSELSGRYGPLGEKVGGEIFFPPRRFIEIAESILGDDFHEFMDTRFGKGTIRAGVLEFLAGYQKDTEGNYFSKITEFMDTYYDDFHGILELYKYSGGYPRAIFEAIKSQRDGKLVISDARYLDDIYRLLISDCRKFKLDGGELQKILQSIDKPIMQITTSYDTLSTLKKEEIQKYIDYLETSGLIAFIPNISSPAEIKSNTIVPKADKLKLVVSDPAVFISSYGGSRNMTNIFNKITPVLETHKGEALEAMVISHLKFLPVGQITNNIGYVLHVEADKVSEPCDALVWYLNLAGTFVRMPIEIKCFESIHPTEINAEADLLINKYGTKRLIVVSNKKHIEIQEKYVIIPIELFLLLC